MAIAELLLWNLFKGCLNLLLQIQRSSDGITAETNTAISGTPVVTTNAAGLLQPLHNYKFHYRGNSGSGH